jgi:hypothetical protein
LRHPQEITPGAGAWLRDRFDPPDGDAHFSTFGRPTIKLSLDGQTSRFQNQSETDRKQYDSQEAHGKPRSFF